MGCGDWKGWKKGCRRHMIGLVGDSGATYGKKLGELYGVDGCSGC